MSLGWQSCQILLNNIHSICYLYQTETHKCHLHGTRNLDLDAYMCRGRGGGIMVDHELVNVDNHYDSLIKYAIYLSILAIPA